MTTQRSFDDESRHELEQLQIALNEQMQGDAPDVFELANAFIDRQNAAIGKPFWWWGKRYIWVKNEEGRLCSERF